ncbi:RE1 [Symbiodinium sp. CCMP2456]|nr:RE1 [Symbiodinium sp. CCMP2456]
MQPASGSASWLACLARMEGFAKEPTLFRGNNNDLTKMVLHADDGILASTKASREKIVEQLGKRVVVQVSEPLSFDQGIEFLKRRYVIDEHGIIMYPSTKYLDTLLAALGNVKERDSPACALFLEADGSDVLGVDEAKLYRECVGRLLYVSHTRCDIQFAVCCLASCMAEPTVQAMKNLKRVAGYLKRVPTIGFRLKALTANACVDYEGSGTAQPGDRVCLESVTDADWAGSKKDRRSRSSVQVYLSGSLLTSYVRTQKNISLSSGESEFISLVSGAGEALFISECLEFMTSSKYTIETVLRTDSAAARGISQRQGVGRVRHLSCGLLWVQAGIKDKLFRASPITGARNPSDLGTKPLSGAKVKELLCRAGAVTDSGAPYGEDELQDANYKASVRMVAKSGGLNGPAVKRIMPILMLMMQVVTTEGHGFEGLGVAMAITMAENVVTEAVSFVVAVLTVLVVFTGIPAGFWLLSKKVMQWVFKKWRPKQFVEAGVQTVERWRQDDTRWAEEYTRRNRELEEALRDRCKEVNECSRALVQVRRDLRASEAEVMRLRSTSGAEDICIATSRGQVYHKPGCGALRSSNSVKKYQACGICFRG